MLLSITLITKIMPFCILCKNRQNRHFNIFKNNLMTPRSLGNFRELIGGSELLLLKRIF